MHDVALVDEPDASPAAQRRSDRRIAELGLRAVDRRLIAADLRLELCHRGALRVELLRCSEIARREIAEALQVESSVGHIGLVLDFFGDRMIVRGLKGTRIDLCQEISRLDVLTFGERYF